MRYMADSIDRTQIPPTVTVPGRGNQDVSLHAGYVNGSYSRSSLPADVLIDVAATNPGGADVLDIETGDATPNSAPNWVKAHNAARPGYPAILYCNRSTLTAVANACAAAGLQVNKDYKWWISTLDGTQSVADMTGVVAIQAWGANFFPGINIDLSIVFDDNWKESSMGPVDLTPAAVQAIATAIRSDQFTIDQGPATGTKIADQTAWRNTLDTVTQIQADIVAIKRKLGI